jgi:hypothetical protein
MQALFSECPSEDFLSPLNHLDSMEPILIRGGASIVENRYRRLAKDWENLIRSGALLKLASIRLMLRKLCNP